ncbi:MAG: phosphoserine phosphatase SerB [Thermoleophilia bacterium]|nr:phosphoserine phosphatase SerB [Thermoleophilia bacterium]
MPTAYLHVTAAGPDRPGLASDFLGLAAGLRGNLRDIAYTRAGGQVLMGVVVDAPGPEPDPDVARAFDALATRHRGLTVLLETRAEAAFAPPDQAELTVLGADLTASAVDRLADRIEAGGGLVAGIRQVATDPVPAVRVRFTEPSPAEALHRALGEQARTLGVDVAVHDAASRRHPKRLLVMDVDSTLIRAEMIDVMAADVGRGDEVAAVTERAMRGELDFAESLHRRVALLEGMPEERVDALAHDVPLMPGARTLIRTLKAHGYRIGIVSGGFTHVTDVLARMLGIDYAAANTLEVRGGRLTGRVTGPVVDRRGKAEALARFAEREGVPLDQTVAIGDGANDLDMLAKAGLGIAFNAKPVVREAADASLSVPYLDAALYLLGLTREAVVAAE